MIVSGFYTPSEPNSYLPAHPDTHWYILVSSRGSSNRHYGHTFSTRQAIYMTLKLRVVDRQPPLDGEFVFVTTSNSEPVPVGNGHLMALRGEGHLAPRRMLLRPQQLPRPPETFCRL